MHGTAWAVLLLVCVPWVSPQELVLATNDDDPPHAAPPSPFSSPPSSPYQPAHPPPPMAATPNATALEVSCGGLAAYVYTECSAIPGSEPCCDAIHTFLDDQRRCICHEPAVRGLFEQADISSVNFVSRACRMDLNGLILHQLEECDAAASPPQGLERAAAADVDPLRHVVGLTPAMRRASGSVEKAVAGVSQYGVWSSCKQIPDTQYCVWRFATTASLDDVSLAVCVPADTDQAAMERVSASLASSAAGPGSAAWNLAGWTLGSGPPPSRVRCLPWLLQTGVWMQLESLLAVARENQGACGTLVLLVSLMATCALCTYLRDCDGRRGCCTLVRGVRRAFDLRDSFYQLSAPRSKKSFDVLNFDVINGMRTLSMVLIILGHTYLWQNMIGYHNPEVVARFSAHSGGLLMYFATIQSVNTFFVFSGLLTTMGTLAKLRQLRDTSAGAWRWAAFTHDFFGGRMARILPSIITVMLVGWQLVPRLRGEGPFWSTDAARFVGECDTQWLQTILLSNNLSTRTRTHNMCLGHTWYLMVDLQLMFNLAPLLFNVHWKYGKRWGLLAGVVSLLVSMAVGAYVVVRDDISVTQMMGGTDAFYIKPWTRAPAYLVGLLLGMALDPDDRGADGAGPVRHSRRGVYLRGLPAWCLTVGQALCASLMVCLLTVLPQPAFREGVIWPTAQNALFIVLSPVAWALCVAYFLWLAARRRAPLVQWALGGRFWDPFARLTFGAYLIHPILLSIENSLESDLHTFSPSHVVKDAVAVTFAAYACALVLWCVVEAPCSKLFKDCVSAPLNQWAASASSPSASSSPKSADGNPFLWKSTLSPLPDVLDEVDEEDSEGGVSLPSQGS